MTLFSLNSPSSRTARALAAVALLFVLGLQLQEAGHSHGADDAFAQCMLCKSGPGTAAVSLQAPLVSLEAGSTPSSTAAIAPVLSGAGLSYQARGPPDYS